MRPRSSPIRFRVDPRDVPAEKAARRLHLSLAEFEAKLPDLLGRSFPLPDPTTGMYDLAAIDDWMTARRGPQPCALTAELKPRDAAEVFTQRRRAGHIA